MINRQKNWSRERKIETFNKYGGCFCSCCDETNVDVLSIDHINGGGNRHRKQNNISGGAQFYKWLRDNNYPSGFRVLCHNCNFSLGIHKYCPHDNMHSIRFFFINISNFENDVIESSIETDIKQCVDCRLIKHISKFGINRRNKDLHKNYCNTCSYIKQKKWINKIKMIVFNKYSNDEIKCRCCNEEKIEFLVLDHIYGNGGVERKQISQTFYKWIIDKKFPTGYQILCQNCNWNRRFGACHIL